MLFVEDLNSLPPLHIAAYKGDTRTIQSLSASGEPVDRRANLAQDYGKMLHNLTPLMVAAGSDYSNVETVRLLLDLGADPQARSAGDVTALWYAASSGDVIRVKFLLELDGNPNESVDIGRSLVSEAATAGDVASIQLLLSAGASPHPFANADSYASISRYVIPLFRAAASGNAACVAALLAAGVSAQVRDSSGQTALYCARSAEVVAVLLKAGCPLNALDKVGNTALDSALDDEQADVVRELVTAGVSLEERDKYGSTPLLKLCFSMEVSAVMVQLLIDLGADIGARTYHGRTALHQAAELWAGDRRGLLGDVIRILVKAGISVDIRDDGGCTPLHLAVGTEGTDIGAVEALVDLGGRCQCG